MSIFEDTNPRSLKELLAQIDTKESVLPNFQRDFVWEPAATQDLIISIASNYPAGSLLRIRNTKNLFEYREFEGAPLLNGAQPTYLVLDGQQRLTSLYQAFFGKGEYKYYFNLQKLFAGNDLDTVVFHLRAKDKRVSHFAKLAVQAQELVMPLDQVKDGVGSYVHWAVQVSQTEPSADAQQKLLAKLLDIQNTLIKTIDSYQFPVVTLSDTTGAEAVCTIFETLNRTGVKLSVFELLTARFWPKGVDLRKLWDGTRVNHPIIKGFEVDPYYLLQTVSLVAGTTPSCKRSDVLNLTAAAINKHWLEVSKCFDQGLQMLQNECGVFAPKWLPYQTQLVPLAAILLKNPLQGNASDGAKRHKLKRWFWCCVFGQAYENSPNSQAAKDVGEVTAWLAGGPEPETVSKFHFDAASLRQTTPRQRAVYRGVISLLLSNGPYDFYNGTKITSATIQSQDDHHIFPQDYLKQHNTATVLRDCVINRTLIDTLTNIRISNHPPSQYMSGISNHLGQGIFQHLLRSHLLPSDAQSPLWIDDFAAFLNWREDALKQQITKVTS